MALSRRLVAQDETSKRYQRWTDYLTRRRLNQFNTSSLQRAKQDTADMSVVEQAAATWYRVRTRLAA